MARKPNSHLTRIRRICPSLTDTKETMTWAKPHFRVGDKILSGCSEERGTSDISFKLEMKHAAADVWRKLFAQNRCGLAGSMVH